MHNELDLLNVNELHSTIVRQICPQYVLLDVLVAITIVERVAGFVSLPTAVKYPLYSG